MQEQLVFFRGNRNKIKYFCSKLKILFFNCQIRIPIRFKCTIHHSDVRLYWNIFLNKKLQQSMILKTYLKNYLTNKNILKAVNWRLTSLSICLTFPHEMRNLVWIHNSRFISKSLITLIFTFKFSSDISWWLSQWCSFYFQRF